MHFLIFILVKKNSNEPIKDLEIINEFDNNIFSDTFEKCKTRLDDHHQNVKGRNWKIINH